MRNSNYEVAVISGHIDCFCVTSEIIAVKQDFLLQKLKQATATLKQAAVIHCKKQMKLKNKHFVQATLYFYLRKTYIYVGNSFLTSFYCQKSFCK